MRRSVFGKTLWEQRRALFGWALGIAGVGVLYAAFYPSMTSPGLVEAMEQFNPELMEAFGFADIISPAGYLGSTSFGILGPVLAIIFGAWFGTKAVAGDEHAGLLDALLAHPLSRGRLVLERFLALVAGATIVCLALFVALFLISGVAGLGEIGPARLAAASIHLAALAVCFGGLALGIGAATASRGLAVLVVAVVGVVGYFGNTMADRLPEIEILRTLSPFRLYSGGRPLVNGLQVPDVTLLLVVAAVCVVLGAIAFGRRDVAV